jgi:hypothetical protein
MPEAPPVQPYDVHNQFLVSNARPPDWANPEPAGRYNLELPDEQYQRGLRPT